MGDNEAPASKTGWQKFWTELLPPEMQLILATAVSLAIVIIVAWVGINEKGRMETFDKNYQARSIESGAVIFDSTCSGCHGPQGQGIVGVAPALNAPDLFNGERLESHGWTGSLRDYVELTVSAGRPTGTQYPNPMPTWSQEYGGPLRPDEVQDVVNFVLNWEETALAGEAPEAAEAPTPDESAPAEHFCGTSMDVELPEGDAANGEMLFNGELGCSGCHVAGAGTVAPPLEGLGERAATRVEGQSAEDYIHESIVQPDKYVVEGFEPIMGTLAFGDRLTCQDIADLVAFVMTQ